jgi:3-oxoacyl-[acyl-carrier-protein] synthase II
LIIIKKKLNKNIFLFNFFYNSGGIMETRRVVVTGLGVTTALASDIDGFFKALEEGKTSIKPIKSFDASNHSVQIAAEIEDFNPDEYIDKKISKRYDRVTQLGVVSAKKALEDSKFVIDDSNRERVGVVFGSGIGGILTLEKQHDIINQKGPSRVSPLLVPMMIANMIAGNISIEVGAKGVNYLVCTACASANNAMGAALNEIRLNKADVIITGGAESSITPLTIAGFAQMKALSKRNDDYLKASRPFDKNRDGFVMGEGSGVLIFEELEHAKKRGAKIYAEVVGFGATADANDMVAPCSDGDGAVRSMSLALQDAKISPDLIDLINAHGTSTPVGDRAEVVAVKRVFKNTMDKIMMHSTKSMIGHLLGASGGVEAIASMLAFEKNVIHPTINIEEVEDEMKMNFVPNKKIEKEVNYILSNSLGFGGHNASIIFKRYKD